MAYGKPIAADIMQRAIMAAKLVDLEDDWTGDPLWKVQSYSRDCQGYRAGYPATQKLYKEVERGKYKRLMEDFRDDHPEYADAFAAIFSDPTNIPSYPRFRKYVELGRHPILTNPEIWDKLPDAFETLYYVSLWSIGLIEESLDNGVVNKRLSMKTAMKMYHDEQHAFIDYEEQERQQSRHEHSMQRLDNEMRRRVMSDMIDTYIKQVLNEIPDEIEREVEQRKQQFLTEHPDLDAYCLEMDLALLRSMSRPRPTPEEKKENEERSQQFFKYIEEQREKYWEEKIQRREELRKARKEAALAP